MTSQPVPSGIYMIVSPSGISIPQTEQPSSSSQSDNNLKKGLKEESKVLGTVQILTGLMILSLGIILACLPDSSYFKSSCSKVVKSGYPFVGGLLFIASGSLSVVLEKKKTKSMIRISLAADVISGIAALAGLILFSVIFSGLQEGATQCLQQVSDAHKNDPNTTPSYYIFYHDSSNSWVCEIANSALTGTFSIMLILSGLELSIAVFAALFSCKRMLEISNGSVLFLPHSHGINSSLRTALQEQSYEELKTST